MKYILLQCDNTYYPFIFSDKINHSDMFMTVLRGIVSKDNSRLLSGADCIGAGFINHNGLCYGRSETLGINSNNNDTDIISGSLNILRYFFTKDGDEVYPFLCSTLIKEEDAFNFVNRVRIFPTNSKKWSRPLSKLKCLSSGLSAFPINCFNVDQSLNTTTNDDDSIIFSPFFY